MLSIEILLTEDEPGYYHSESRCGTFDSFGEANLDVVESDQAEKNGSKPNDKERRN